MTVINRIGEDCIKVKVRIWELTISRGGQVRVQHTIFKEIQAIIGILWPLNLEKMKHYEESRPDIQKLKWAPKKAIS